MDPPVSADLDKEALKFEPMPDKAVVYLYRGCFDIPDMRALIIIDKQPIAFNFACRFLRIPVEPGNHEFFSEFEWFKGLSFKEMASSDPKHLRFVSRPQDVSKLDLNVEPGKIYFIKLDLRFATLWGMLDLHLVPEVQAKQEIVRNGFRIIEIPTELPELKSQNSQ